MPSHHNDTVCQKQQWRMCQIKILCQIKPHEIQIAQHKFNSKLVDKKQRMSSHEKETSQLLDWSLFVSVSTLLLRASSWTPDTGIILDRRSTWFGLSWSRICLLPLVHDDYPLLQDTIFHSLQWFHTATVGCAYTPSYEYKESYPWLCSCEFIETVQEKHPLT